MLWWGYLDHPVRLRLPPLRRRGIIPQNNYHPVRHHLPTFWKRGIISKIKTTPPWRATLRRKGITAIIICDIMTIPLGIICHTSKRKKSLSATNQAHEILIIAIVDVDITVIEEDQPRFITIISIGRGRPINI